MLSTFSWYFLSLKGRIGRQEFWLGYIGLIAVMAVLIRMLPRLVQARVVYYDQATGAAGMYLAERLPVIIALCVVIWPLVSTFVKRLHDVGISGWCMVLMIAIPPASRLTSVNSLLLFLAVILVFGLIPGDRGSNRFGADPRARAGL